MMHPQDDGNTGQRPRLFVSFSRAGNTAVPRLVAHLEAQAWDLWIYDRPSDSIPITNAMEESLRAELVRSSACVVLVTESAFGNPFTQLELTWALSQHAAGQLQLAVFVETQVLDKHPDAKAWPAPYNELSRFRYVVVEPNSIVSIGKAVNELCDALKVKYRPLLAEHGRVLLLTRFYEELDAKRDPLSTGKNDVFTYLIRLLEAIHQALDAGDEARATRLMQLCLLYCDKEYPGVRLPYGRILHALHRARAGQPQQALATLSDIQREPQAQTLQNSGLLPAAIGYCHYQLGNYASALEQYTVAAQHHDADVSTACNMLLCRLRLRQPVALPHDFVAIDTAKSYPGDSAVVQFAKALMYRLNGQYQQASALLAPLVEKPATFPSLPEILEEYLRVLGRLGQYSVAQAAVEKTEPAVQCDPRVVRAIAKLHRECGQITHAQSLWRALMADECPAAESYFEAIVGLWNSGACNTAVQYAQRFLDQYPCPGDPFVFYVAGVAQWLLGCQDKAEYDLERSGKQRHYRDLLIPQMPMS